MAKDDKTVEESVVDLIGGDATDDMSKDQIKTYTKLLSKLDKEKVLNAVEQFPNFQEFANNIITMFKDETSELITDNKESRKEAVEALNGRIDFLSQLATNETFGEGTRKEFVYLSIDLAKDIVAVHKDNQAFILKVLGTVAGALGIAFSALITILKLTSKDSDSDSDDDNYDTVYKEIDE